MVLISGINGSGLYAQYSVSAEKDDAGNVITATYMKDALFDYTDTDEISGYNGSAFATPAELSAGINTKIENNIIDVKNVSCSATGSGNIALGTKSIADGKNSFVYGLGGAGVAQNIASGDHSIILGWHSKAIGRYSTILGGNYCLASADVDPNYEPPYSGGPVAQGLGTSSVGHYTHSEGIGTFASNQASHAEGGATSSLGIVSHAEGDHTLAIGSGTHAEGSGTSAYGNCSHSEGIHTEASGDYSHAEGQYTSALNYGSHSEGYYTVASGENAHAEGDYTLAAEEGSHAEGNETKAIGEYSHAEGYGTSALNFDSHAEGYYTIAGSDYMHVAGTYNETTAGALYVIGNGTADDARSDAFIVYANGSVSAQGKISANGVELGATPPALSAGTDLIIENNIISVNTNGIANSADMAFVEGSATLASGKYSHAEGGKTSAIGTFTHAEGTVTKATGEESHAEGWGTFASGHNSHAEGNYTTACGSNSHTEGYQTLAYYNAHAEGDSTSALGNHSHAEGQSTITNNNCAHAEGQHTSAMSLNSHAEGSWTLAQDQCAHAEGHGTSALGYASHTEGDNTIASIEMSHAEGHSTSANGHAAHAEGGWTVANNDYTHTEGRSTSAIGYISHAEGSATVAGEAGAFAHAEGYGTSALLTFSHAEGNCTIANSYAMHAGGMYNKTSADALFVLGNGSADDARSDAFIVTSGGNAIVQHDLSAEGRSLINVYDAVSSNSSTWSDTAYVPLSALDCAIGTDNTATYTAFAQGISNSSYSASFAQGSGNSAICMGFAQGKDNLVNWQNADILNHNHKNSFAQGELNSARFISFTQGDKNYAENKAFAQGSSNSASLTAFAQGNNNSANTYALSQGSNNSASLTSFAQGSTNTAHEISFAQGATNAADKRSFAQGTSNKTSSYSIAQGNKNKAFDYSQAFGNQNFATNSSFIAGIKNSADSEAFVLGSYNNASGAILLGSHLTGKSFEMEDTSYGESFVIGYDVYPVIVGRSNKTSSDAYFVVGNGDDPDAEIRSDAFIVSSNNVASAGDFLAGNGVSLSSLTGINVNSYVKYTDLQYSIGSANTATGSTTSTYSVALGKSNSAYNSFVIGNYNKGKESHILGDSNSGINSYIVGNSCTGTESYLFGRELSGRSWGIELGDFGDTGYPVIVGRQNATKTSAYFVVGCGNTLGNADAFIVSSNKIASAADFKAGNGVSLSSLTGINADSYVKYTDIQYSVGSANTANGSTTSTYSMALGIQNSAYDSFVAGYCNSARDSIVAGYNNEGNESYILGSNCTGTYSYLIGSHLSGNSWRIDLGDILENFYPVIVGKNNATKTSAYFVVGCGTAFGNSKADAFIVSSNKIASAADFLAGNGVSLSSLTGLATTSWANNTFATKTVAQQYANFVGGYGITVAGDIQQTKTINSNLTEVPIQDGTGIHIYEEPNDAYVSISVKPEVFIYQTNSPVARNTDGQFGITLQAGSYSTFNTKNGTVGVNNTDFTGLDANKLYNYNVKVGVTASSPGTVSLYGPNWNNSESRTSAYVSTNSTLELDCYLKGVTSFNVSGAGLNSNIGAGIIEASITEVCDV